MSEPKIIKFKSKFKSDGHSYLSNFYPFVAHPPEGLKLKGSFKDKDGKKFKTSEHYFQYHKYLIIDPEYANTVIYDNKKTAFEIKSLAGQGVYVQWKYDKSKAEGIKKTKTSILKEFKSKKQEWNKKSVDVMKKALYMKFTQNEHLKEKLLSTGDAKLEEIGRYSRDFWANTGQNMLGILLEELRDQFKKNKTPKKKSVKKMPKKEEKIEILDDNKPKEQSFNYTESDLKKLTMVKLKQLIKQKNMLIKGYYKMRKAVLIKAMLDY